MGKTLSVPTQFALVVAGVSIRVSCEGLGIAEEVGDAVYRRFAPQHSGPPDSEIVVDLVVGQAPQDPDWRTLYVGGDAFTLLERQGTLLLQLSPVRNQPIWSAVFAPDARRVTVFCSESLVTESEKGRTIFNPIRYPLDQTLLMYHLARKGGLLLHAGAAKAFGRAWLFSGRSGAGKSTILRLLSGVPDVSLTNDDRTVVRNRQSGFQAYGTPWAGEAGLATNESAPTAGILFLTKSDQNEIRPLSPTAAFDRLMPVASIPWYDRALMNEVMTTCEAFIQTVPAFDLRFKPTEEIAGMLGDFFRQKAGTGERR